MAIIMKCHFNTKDCGKYTQCKKCINCYANPSQQFRNCDACTDRCPSCDADCSRCKLNCSNRRTPYGLF